MFAVLSPSLQSKTISIIHPINGIKQSKIHIPDLFISCSLLTCYIITHITNTYFVIIIPGMNITKHCDDIIIHTGRGSLFNLAASSAGRSLRPLSYSNSFMSRMQVVSYFSADFKAGYEL